MPSLKTFLLFTIKTLLFCIANGNILYAQSIDTFEILSYTNLLTEDIAKKPISTDQKKSVWVMNNLCNKLYSIDKKETKIPYNPRESVFVTIVCGSLTGSYKISPEIMGDTTIQKYLKRKTRSDMTLFCPNSQIESTNNDCTDFSNYNDIDWNYLFLKTIKQVQNDRTNIALARLYGLQDITEQSKPKKLANTYLSRYYEVLANTTEAKDYKTTHKTMTNYIKKAIKLNRQTYLISTKEIIQEKSKSELQQDSCLRYNILFAQPGKGVNPKESKNPGCTTSEYYADQSNIIDILYNELFFYTLFSSVYEQYLPNFRGDSSSTVPSTLKDMKSSERIFVAQQLSKDRRASIISTTQQTIRQLLNLQSSFPLHIGFLLYAEDLLDFRKVVANIYRPLHQLHYKLENVQSKE